MWQTRYLINGDDELRGPDNYEIALSLTGADSMSVFSSEDDFRKWAADHNPELGKQLSDAFTAIDGLSISLRHKFEVNDPRDRLRERVQPRLVAAAGVSVGLTLYEHINYGGRTLSDYTLVPYPNLVWQGFNDMASSMKIAVPVAAVFEHAWFKGRSWWIWGPTDIPWVGSWWNDRVSSCISGPSVEQIIAAIVALGAAL